MIVCTQCGYQNEDDAFCGSCGAFLEWSGEAVDDSATPTSGEEAAGPAPVPGAVVVDDSPPGVEESAQGAPAPGSTRGDSAGATTTTADTRREPREVDQPLAPPAPAATKTPAAETERVATRAVERERAAASSVGQQEVDVRERDMRESARSGGAGTGEPGRRAVTAPTGEAVGQAREAARSPVTATAEARAKTATEAEATEDAKADTRAAALLARTPVSQPAPPPPTARAPTAARAPTRGREADQPVARRPEAIKPTAAPPRPRPVPTRPVAAREIKAGDLICSECDEGNDPARKFCRRCGASLVKAEPAVVIPVPWWKRLFQRKPKVAAAGERPVRRGGSGRRRPSYGAIVRRVAGTVAVLGALGVALGYVGPWRGGPASRVEFGRKMVQRITGDLVPASIVKAEASSQHPEHPAGAAVDRVIQTYWSEAAPGTGENEWLTVTLEAPTDLYRVGFTLGASAKAQDFLNQPRPASVLVTFFNAEGGRVGRKLVSLKDDPKFQDFPVDAKNVATAKIQIMTVHAALNDAGTDCSIAEVEFFKRA